jgi:hypothetical protein
VRSEVTQQAFIFVHRLCWIWAMTDTAALATTDTSAAMSDARELGHSYLRLGLGLGLFFPHIFCNRAPCVFECWVAWAVGRASGGASGAVVVGHRAEGGGVERC